MSAETKLQKIVNLVTEEYQAAFNAYHDENHPFYTSLTGDDVIAIEALHTLQPIYRKILRIATGRK
jgi:hypothetical protein